MSEISNSSSSLGDDAPHAGFEESHSALDLMGAELDLMNDLDASFPMRRKNKTGSKERAKRSISANSRAERIRRDFAVSREIRMKLKAAEQSFAEMELGQSLGNLDHSPVRNNRSLTPDPGASPPSGNEISSKQTKKKKLGLFRKKKPRRSLSWHK